MKRIIKKILAMFGLKISKIHNEEKFLKNVYHTKFEKNVLLSYIKAPFLNSINYNHTNHIECKTAADIFREQGYNVDVIEYNEKDYEIDFSLYSIVYGFGHPFEEAFFSDNAEKLIKIMYSPGCNPFYSHEKTVLRVNDVFKKTGLLIPRSSRGTDFFFPFQYISSDLIISLGNDFVAATYKKTNPAIDVIPIHAFYFDSYDIKIEQKEFNIARKNFLWFGSHGLIHKGLDIAINIFVKRPDINLHICGASKYEKKFFDAYRSIINECPNIKDHGFVDIYSEDFKNIMLTCGSLIFPSVSEGGSPSVLNAIANGGVIPIMSEAAGVDINGLGYVTNEINEISILEQIEKVLNLNEDAFFTKANLCKQWVRTNYTYDLYKANLKKAITRSL